MTAIRSARLALVVASMLCCSSSSTAYIALPKEPLAQKVAFADCGVLGKITAIQITLTSPNRLLKQAGRA
jgi:hypothetical protein